MVECFSSRECQCIRQYFEKNRELNHKKWLEPVEQDNKGEELVGTQGACGILAIRDKPQLRLVYKISLKEDFVVDNEFAILKTLEGQINYCIHIPHVYDLIKVRTPVQYDREQQPLFKSADKMVTRKVLLMQYIRHVCSYFEMITNPSFTDAEVVSIIQQVLMTIYQFQNIQLTHYDLHASNILITRCLPKTGILYRLDESTFFIVNSYGYVAKIIDFGFSHCEKNTNKELNATLKHTEKGFMCHRYDPFADCKLFLISIIDDLKNGKRRDLHRLVRRISHNIFKRVRVDWENGWDVSELSTPVEELIATHVQSNLYLFTKDDSWVDILQHLIDTPLSPFPYDTLTETINTFTHEFSKVEARVTNIKTLNIIFRRMVVLVKKYRSSFLRGGEEREWAILTFKDTFTQFFDKTVDFFNPAIDYGVLIRSIISMAHGVEGLYHDSLRNREREKEEQYQRIRSNHVHDAKDCFKIITKLLVKSKKNTQYDGIYAVDCVLKQTQWIDLKPLWKTPVPSDKVDLFIYNYYLSTLIPTVVSMSC
jgi:serine/threonine protein kinase